MVLSTSSLFIPSQQYGRHKGTKMTALYSGLRIYNLAVGIFTYNIHTYRTRQKATNAIIIFLKQ